MPVTSVGVRFVATEMKRTLFFLCGHFAWNWTSYIEAVGHCSWKDLMVRNVFVLLDRVGFQLLVHVCVYPSISRASMRSVCMEERGDEGSNWTLGLGFVRLSL